MLAIKKFPLKILLLFALALAAWNFPVSAYPEYLFYLYSKFKYGDEVVYSGDAYVLADGFYINGIKGKTHSVKQYGNENVKITLTFGVFNLEGFNGFLQERNVEPNFKNQFCVAAKSSKKSESSQEYIMLNSEHDFSLILNHVGELKDVDFLSYCSVFRKVKH